MSDGTICNTKGCRLYARKCEEHMREYAEKLYGDELQKLRSEQRAMRELLQWLAHFLGALLAGQRVYIAGSGVPE